MKAQMWTKWKTAALLTESQKRAIRIAFICGEESARDVAQRFTVPQEYVKYLVTQASEGK